ncbi:uncharacterized protein Z520_09354 [Fonsecaea multimorphosa CBS 102226]|uniref:CoA-transferase family III n=1 Tax=Fonsecaea multimorphosa CBS 102226 TaxID=1442371 RepID=A0A0D2JX09_9EURO|nr:uncharacterized protein Z520_09354 [Fonsecaea multimorphosa CBS 102226]KIX95044.1 hypothetical protein Z520_09354 [Fonsecaea multimorphosa CBS 102226]OAL20688.1 hypothetical protein AYO22_08697 [Fonsecaea multimorphosa]
MDRSHFGTIDSITSLWKALGLPAKALTAIHLPDVDTIGIPSSFKIGHLAQASIALTGLLAALIYSERQGSEHVPTVTVPLKHALIEFRSERFFTLGGQRLPSPWGPIGGLHRASDGYVRVHDSFPNHRAGALELLGLPEDADRKAVGAKIAPWRCVDLENAAVDAGVVIAALRSYEQWDVLPQARAIKDFPIQIKKIAGDGDADCGAGWWSDSMSMSHDNGNARGSGADKAKDTKALRGLRVLEMSRVIAAPVAGRALAAHGADVLWITSPNLPDQPSLDRDTARGKRTARLNLDLSHKPEHNDMETLLSLLDDADVFLQGYRPGSLAARGLSCETLVARRRQNGIKRGIICANLSAYGPDGPWSHRRGFDSLVQTCSGMNVSEAEHFRTGDIDQVTAADDDDTPPKPTPCQALDHASGYFLAAGIMAALCRQAHEGGSYEVSVSLAGTMKYLRSLGQYEGRSGFDHLQCKDHYATIEDIPEEFLEEHMSGFGLLKAVRHAASIDGVPVGWDLMPKHLGSDEARWLARS